MKIKFKLYATLGEYLPAGTVANTVEVDAERAASPYSLLDQFKVPRAKAHLVLVNGVYVPPAARESFVLEDGDTLAIWPPVAGG